MQNNTLPAAGIGHNSQLVDPALLAQDHAKTLARVEALAQAAGRIPDDPNDEEAQGLADFKKQITTCESAIEEARKQAKEPYFRAGQFVDTFFKAPINVLADAKLQVNRSLKVYMDRKDKEEKDRRAAEELRLKAEAETRAKAAAVLAENNMPDQADALLDQAIQSETEAQQYSAAIQSNPNPTKVRGVTGATVSYQTRIVGEIVNRHELDLEALRPYLPLAALQTALNAYIKAGGKTLRGANIKEEKSVR